MRVLILCTDNSYRSQMTYRFLQSFNKEIEVFSAGAKPAESYKTTAISINELQTTLPN